MPSVVESETAAGTVALFTRGLNGGGVQHVMRHLACELVRRGYRVDLLTPSRKHAHLIDAGIGIQKLQRLPRGIGRLLALRADSDGFAALARPVLLTPFAAAPLGLLPSLMGYLRTARPDAVISATTYMNLVALWARRLTGISTKILVSEHSHLSENIKSGRAGQAWRWRHVPALLARTYPWADAVTAVSNGVRDDLAAIASLPDGLIRTIYNPVITSDLHLKAAAALDDPWFQPGAPPVIIAVGRLVAKKDHATLIRAFARLRQSRSVRLMIIGDGVKQRPLIDLARRLHLFPSIRFTGWVDNPLPYMARARIFALSSSCEGFGNALVEAMACGCPVVATDCPSGPAEVLENGRFGRLVPVGDDQALADAIGRTLDDPVVPDALKLRASAFTIARSVDHYLEALGLPIHQAGRR